MERLADAIRHQATCPYIYTYPTTRCFVPVTAFSISQIAFTPLLNLYFHIPFCSQKCSFCGYLTFISRDGTVMERYVDALLAELTMRAPVLGRSIITSVNFGGGTPSLLPPAEIARILAKLDELAPDWRKTCRELSIETTPEAVDEAKFRQLVNLGFNRASVGIESFDAKEIGQAKRHNGQEVSLAAITTLRSAGIKNICCDLMYGLAGQTLASWNQSVELLVSRQPETIELYHTVAVPGTAFARQGIAMSDSDKHACYRVAREKILQAGYQQDCHLRFIRPGLGAYRQQANVFAGQSLLGFGVGARSYAGNCHFRNAGDAQQPRPSIEYYLRLMAQQIEPVAAAITLTLEERARRWLIFRLENFFWSDFRELFGFSLANDFLPSTQEFVRLKLANLENDHFCLNDLGLAYRDVIAQSLFSWATEQKEEAYYVHV